MKLKSIFRKFVIFPHTCTECHHKFLLTIMWHFDVTGKWVWSAHRDDYVRTNYNNWFCTDCFKERAHSINWTTEKYAKQLFLKYKEWLEEIEEERRNETNN